MFVKFDDKKFNILGFLKIRNVSKPVKLAVTILEDYSPDSEKLFFYSIKLSTPSIWCDDLYPLVRDNIIIQDALMLSKIMAP